MLVGLQIEERLAPASSRPRCSRALGLLVGLYQEQ